MPFMINFEFGDVVLVPFPFTDQSAGKKRPAVVISSVAYNNERPDLIIMAVTSQIKSMQVYWRSGYLGMARSRAAQTFGH